MLCMFRVLHLVTYISLQSNAFRLFHRILHAPCALVSSTRSVHTLHLHMLACTSTYLHALPPILRAPHSQRAPCAPHAPRALRTQRAPNHPCVPCAPRILMYLHVLACTYIHSNTLEILHVLHTFICVLTIRTGSGNFRPLCTLPCASCIPACLAFL